MDQFGRVSRPTTSRGKAHPSPDEFFDYVIPSPVKASARPESCTVNKKYDFPLQSSHCIRSAGRTPFHPESISQEFQLSSNFNLQVINENEGRTEQEVRMLACWLFGCALKV